MFVVTYLAESFDLKKIYVNTFWKMFPLRFILTNTLKCVLDNRYNVLSAKQKIKRLDI